MTLLLLDYLVYCLDNCIDDAPIETGLIKYKLTEHVAQGPSRRPSAELAITSGPFRESRARSRAFLDRSISTCGGCARHACSVVVAMGSDKQEGPAPCM